MKLKTAFLSCLILFSFCSAFAQDDLDNYINRLKVSKASGGKETAFMSAGSEFVYGQEYFEAKRYDMSVMYFMRAQNAEPENPYFNYQLAIALLKQNDKYKAQQAQPYLEKAFQLNAGLKKRFAADMPQAANTKPATKDAAPTDNKGAAKGLDAYLEELRYSRATSGAKTAMFTSGREVMSGYDYYEKGEMRSAETSFYLAVAADKEDIYANYLLGVSLAAQGKKAEAKPYLSKALAGDGQLAKQMVTDVAVATAAHKKYEASRQPVTSAPVKEKVGGKLFMGSYVCRLAVWNGPNASPAYSYKDQGTIHLKADGTYRWLDNGPVGKYSYDPQTGKIKWLSGHMAGYTIQSSVFQPGDKVASISINFSDTYRWGCGCTK